MPVTTNLRSMRRSLGVASATTMLGISLSACSGGTGVAGIGGSPEDASVDDFCQAYTSLQDSILEDLDPSASPEDQAQRAVGLLQDWTSRLEEVGTPSDIPDEARQGYELIIETASDLPTDAAPSDISGLESQFSDAQNEAADAFGTYATETCPVSLPDLPSELPSDLPTDQLPSDLPTDRLPSDLPSDLSLEDLPSDFPTELLSDLPSEFSASDLPSDFPTELFSEVPRTN